MEVAMELAMELADGSSPATPDTVLQMLADLGLRATTFEHEAVFTVDEAKALRGPLEGAHVKNLFLRNKKGRMWIVTCLEDRRIDLKALGEEIGAGRLSFASPERLMKYLGVIPGAVTALAAINDTGGAVGVVLDKSLLNYDLINVHPLVNTMTTTLSPGDLLKFLEAASHPPVVVDLDPICLG